MSLVPVSSQALRSLVRGVALGLLIALAACSGGGGSGGTSGTGRTIKSIEVTPNNPQVAVGTSAQLTATAIFSDGSHQDVTANVVWASSNERAATVSYGLATGLRTGSSTISASASGVTGQTSLAVTASALMKIEVTPPNPSVAKGSKAQFTATGIFSDQSTQNLTSQVTWMSSDPAVATVTNAAGSAGLATATGMGNTLVSASLNGVTSAGVSLTVTSATLVAIQVTPANPSIASGLTRQFTATGTYTDNSTQDLTAMVTWASSATNIASISNTGATAGLASAAAAGSTSISASLGGVTSPAVTLTVTAATLVSIQVSPANPTVASGLTQQFTATGLYTDNSTQDLTAAVTWSSSDTGVAGISNATGSNGLGTTMTSGTSSITATSGTVTSNSATLIVTAATLVSIQVNPPSPSIANGLTQQFTATGIYTDNSTHDLTTTVTWASSDGGVANVSNAAGSQGLGTALAAGTSSITATSGSVTSNPAVLTVTQAVLATIQVDPPSPSIAAGLAQQFTATGIYTDNSTHDLTTSVTWSSSNGGVATISSAAGSGGLATAAGTGTSSITATSGTITSNSATLTVTAATLVSIQLNPPAPSIANGVTEQFSATGIYTDNSSQDLTSTASWASSDPGVATISNTAGSNGLASSAGTGTTQITASLGGVTSSAAVLTVTPATLVSIQVNPPGPSIASGLTQQFTATGLYTDNSTQDLTNTVTWASSNGSVASISNASGSNGLATASGAGTSNISASLNTVTSPAATLTVTAATLVAIQVSPIAPSIATGLTQQFTAIGTYTDNSTQDLTTVVTWASNNGSVATISNAPGSNGLATSATVGSASISATLNSVNSPPASLTVTAATLVSIEVTPPDPSIASGLTQQFAAIGTYTDGSTQDLTSAVTWAAGDGSVATISNVTGSSGLATATGAGSTSVSASLNAVTSPPATLTVTAATLVSIQVTPASASIANGLTQQFTAIGTYTDNSTQDLTSAVTWASSNSAVASISNASGSNGLATASGVGSSNVSASLGSISAPAASLTVTAAVTGATGVWTATPAAGVSAFMISDGAGDFFYYTSSATCVGLYTGTLVVNGTAVTGSGDFAPDVFGPTGCPSAVHENYSGTVVPGVSMALTASPSGGGASTTINWTYDPLYAQSSALALVAGTWSMPGGSTAVISSSGAITAHDASTGCTLTGQLSIGDPTVNLYNISAKYSGCSGTAASLNGVPLTGLATLDTTVTPNQFDAFLRSANKKTLAAFSWVQ